MKNFEKAILISGGIKKTLIKQTIPMFFGLLGMISFNLADTFFVSRLGTNELAALSFTFPVIYVIQSIALGIGVGCSATISRAIGAKNYEDAKKYTTGGLILGFILVLIIAVLGILTIEPLFKLLGAEKNTLPLIKRYMKIWYIGVVFVVIPMVGNNALRAIGEMKIPGMIMLTAVFVNIILDPLLIFGIGPFPRMEIEGAALATVIARATTFTVSLSILIFKEKMVISKLNKLKEIIYSWKKILFIGIPASASKLIIPLTIGIITKLLSKYGNEAVAAYGVSSRIEFFVLSTILALATVIGPYVGQNAGSGKKERVIKGVRYSKYFSLLWGAAFTVILAVFSKSIGSIFSSKREVIKYISLYLIIVPVSYGLQGFVLLSNEALNALHKPFHASFLSFFEMFVIYIPLAYVLSQYSDVKGIFLGLTISYIISGILAHFVLKQRINVYFNNIKITDNLSNQEIT